MSSRLIAEWQEAPFTDIKRRSVTVDHRVIAETYPGIGADIRHEVRCDEYGHADGWTAAEVYEIRDHGVIRVKSDGEWWT